MDRMKRFVGVLLVAALAALPSQAVDLPTATPEDVGLSSARLERLSGAMQEFVDDGRLAGTITMVARRGKVVHFEPVGMMDALGRRLRLHRRRDHRARADLGPGVGRVVLLGRCGEHLLLDRS
jgi:hypothetical protein